MMMEMMEMKGKQLIYWIGYSVILIIGIYLSANKIVPVQTASIFLLGLIWIWMGCTVIFKTNPYYAQKYVRKHQMLMALSSLGLGVSWVLLSLTPYSKRGIPVALVSVPFIFIDLWIYLHKSMAPK